MSIRVLLKDIASFSKGEQINGEDLIQDGTYPYLNGGIQPSGRWSDCNTPENTITISEGGNSCGYVNLVTEPFWCGAHCYYLYDLRVDVQYLYYALKSQQARLMGIRSGACMPNIKKNALGCFELTIHTENVDQKQIVEQLQLCQSLIEQRQRQLRALDTLIKARFVEMFGNPIFNEKGFETKPGSDIFNLSNGKFVPESKRFEDGIPVYGGNGVSWYTDEVLFENDTIVVGRVGFQSGNVHLVKGPLWISDNAMYVSNLFDDGFDLRFLYFVMEHIDFTRFQDAGDLRKITQKPFMVMRYIMPPLRMQLDYISFVAQIDKSKLSSDIVQRISDMQYNVH